MNLDCIHVVSRAHDLAATKEFYGGTLGLPVIMDTPHMLALKAGALRLSFHGGYALPETDPGESVGNSIILRTSDLESTVATLRERGVEFLEEIVEAPGFMKFISLRDPSGNIVFLGEYLSENV